MLTDGRLAEGEWTETERRRFRRLRPPIPLPAIVGGQHASVVDLGERGARIVHAGILHLGTDVPLQLRFGSAAVVLDARVLGSRIVDVIRDEIFETRLYFEPKDPIESRAIAAILRGLKDLQERLWIRNAEGYIREDPVPEDGPFRSFIRVTKVPTGWRQSKTTNPEQPPDGLTLPPSTVPWEIELICESYDGFNQEWKDLLRAMATLACGREISKRERKKFQ